FAPLGMDRTFFRAEDVLADGDYAIGASAYPGVPSVVLPDSYENVWARPAGYATSSVEDLAKFVLFLMHGDEDVLSANHHQAMQTARVDTQELLDLVGYGYGLQVLDGAFLGRAFY